MKRSAQLQEYLETLARSLPAARPTTASEFKSMNRIARLTPQLEQVYSEVSELGVGEVEFFEPEIYCDVNNERADFGDLAEMLFFANDKASGFFFIDTLDILGLGAGFVYWTDRGLMGADDVVPCAKDVAAFLADLEAGKKPWLASSLGQRAVERFREAVANAPPELLFRPPVNPDEFSQMREEKGLLIPYLTGEVLWVANGMQLQKGDREIYALAQMKPLQDGHLILFGFDRTLGYLAVSFNGWNNIPDDRLIAFHNYDNPETGQLLGRVPDVLTFWIEQESGS